MGLVSGDGTMNEARQYLELKGLDTTYWGRKIIAAEKRGDFTGFNVQQAGDFVTCACGRVTTDIPRCRDYGGPLDSKIVRLGMQFDLDVTYNNFLEAAQTLTDIEARALIVANEHQRESTA